MPALFSLGLNAPLRTFAEELQPTERVWAFLDDIYVTAEPPRVSGLHQRMGQLLQSTVGVRLHAGKTQVWNAAGAEPLGVRELSPGGDCWLGDSSRPAEERGLRVLGLRVGSPPYVVRELAALQVRQQRLFDLLPTVPDLQSAWLLLLYCAGPRVHHALRGVRPELSEEFADQHDQSVSQCLAALLQLPSLPEEAVLRAKLALRHGGLGLRSARMHAEAAYWASWADCLPAMRSRFPDLAAVPQAQLELPCGAVLPSARSLADARAPLVEAGADLPAWDSLGGPPRQDR